MRIILLLLLGCGTPGPMQNLGTEAGPCGDFSSWGEVPSPFEGERCFMFSANHHQAGVVCKQTESLHLKACADPKLRPDQKSAAPAVQR
jgi:hypothetical protein